MKKKIRKILIILLITMGFIFINYIIHIIKTNNEFNYLNDKGYINLIKTDNYRLNVYKHGNENGKHRIIGLSGRGINNYSIEMKFATENLINDNLFVYVDRAGYGFSEDTNITQTVEEVVNSYRTALINAGIKAPYILMPHSLGGVYATYWESMYPNEIEGVIFIDSTEVGENVWNKEDFSVGVFDYLGPIVSKEGFQRYFLHKTYYELPNNYSSEDKMISDYLNINSFSTKASLSEIKETNNNTNKAYKNIKTNNIPKIYISSSSGFSTIEELKEYNSWLINRQKEVGIKIKSNTNPDNDTLEKTLPLYENYRNNKIKPYIEKLGNTKLILLPGDHMIFEEKPNELNKIINDFLNTYN